MIYNLRVATTLAAGVPFLALVPAARSFEILEIDAQGMGIASGANEFGIYQIATAGLGAGLPLPTGVNPLDPALVTGGALTFSGSACVGYATSPPVAGALLHNAPLNSNGQRYFYRVNPNTNNAIVVPGGSLGVLLAPLSGSGAIVVRLQVGDK
jgi:hypothetical protein